MMALLNLKSHSIFVELKINVSIICNFDAINNQLTCAQLPLGQSVKRNQWKMGNRRKNWLKSHSYELR